MRGFFAPLVYFACLSGSWTSVTAQTYQPATWEPVLEARQDLATSCGTESSQDSMCRVMFVNSVDDFCLYAPPTVDTIGDAEAICVAYCLRSGYGTRLIPDGTIQGAHFIQTTEYVQVTGIGDFTKINIAPGDPGGELDPHGATGLGNPIGAAVFGTSFGGLMQYTEWTNFMGFNEFCIRACLDGPNAAELCQHIYDVMGCDWNMPGDYSAAFDTCDADLTEPMGVYVIPNPDGTGVITSTFFQGEPVTPPAHTPGASSDCVAIASVSNQPAVPLPAPATAPAAPASQLTAPAAPASQSTGASLSTAVVTPSASSSSNLPTLSQLSFGPSSTIPSVVTSVVVVGASPTTASSGDPVSLSLRTGLFLGLFWCIYLMY